MTAMAVQFKDYYEVLGTSKTATEDEIRKAYRKLARKHHPDVNPGDKSAEDKFKEVSEAYEVLSDPEKRKRYDQFGSDWKAGPDFTPPPRSGNGNTGFDPGMDYDFGAAQGSTSGFSDFFENLFGRSRGARAGAGFRMRGNDVEAEITINLEEAHRGIKRSIGFEATEICPTCGGTGTKDEKTCPLQLLTKFELELMQTTGPHPPMPNNSQCDLGFHRQQRHPQEGYRVGRHRVHNFPNRAKFAHSRGAHYPARTFRSGRTPGFSCPLKPRLTS